MTEFDASARDEGGPVAAPPWQLTPSEINAFAADGLVPQRIEDLRDTERHRCRATFHRPAPERAGGGVG